MQLPVVSDAFATAEFRQRNDTAGGFVHFYVASIINCVYLADCGRTHMGDTLDWNGGNGAFSTPSKWTDITNPGSSGPPGTNDIANFVAGGAITGAGTVSEISVSASISLNGTFDAGFITSSGTITVTGGSLSTSGNFTSSGLISVTHGAVTGGYIGNTGTIKGSGGTFGSSDFISNDGSIAISGTGSLSDAGAL